MSVPPETEGSSVQTSFHETTRSRAGIAEEDGIDVDAGRTIWGRWLLLLTRRLARSR